MKKVIKNNNKVFILFIIFEGLYDNNIINYIVSLNRETVDALLQTLSPTCRVEFEQIIESQGGVDISMECKIEIQNTLQQMGGLNMEQQQQQQQQQQQEQEQFDRRKKKQTVPSKDGIHPLIYIFGFLILAVIAFTVAVFNVSSKQKGAEIRKKISKKKLEKQKLKDQQRR